MLCTESTSEVYLSSNDSTNFSSVFYGYPKWRRGRFACQSVSLIQETWCDTEISKSEEEREAGKRKSIVSTLLIPSVVWHYQFGRTHFFFSVQYVHTHSQVRPDTKIQAAKGTDTTWTNRHQDILLVPPTQQKSADPIEGLVFSVKTNLRFLKSNQLPHTPQQTYSEGGGKITMSCVLQKLVVFTSTRRKWS